MAQQGTGRHRASVEVNVFETMEIRSRRSIREAEKRRNSREAKRQAKREAKVEQVLELEAQEATGTSKYLVTARPHVKFTKRKDVRNAISMAFAAGLFTTVALPAYAFSPEVAAMARFSTTNAAALSALGNTQGLTVAAVTAQDFNRTDSYATVSARMIQRQLLANHYFNYTGPSAADFVSNPPYTSLDEAQILKVASKYVGSPYVFGGENPAGFDCSGYVRFVFAQFGIDLPHSVISQSHMGIIVKAQDARPGDIVILNNLSHDGIYAGNGYFYHAPRPGDSVKLAPIFTPDVFFVRLGTK